MQRGCGKGELSLLELRAVTEIKEETSVISESMSLLEGDSGSGKDLSLTESWAPNLARLILAIGGTLGVQGDFFKREA
jgi:hypothetical protein